MGSVSGRSLARAAWAALTLVSALTLPTQAEPVRAASARVEPARAEPVRGESGSALTRLAQRIATVAPTTPAFAAVTPLAGVTLGESDRTELDAKLARVLGSAVIGTRGRGTAAMSESAARERSRELGLSLVLVRPTLAGGQLSVDVDIIEWELSFWARTRKPQGTVVTHASFSEPADTEIRRYLPRPPGLLRSESRFTVPERDAIGLACGDVRAPGMTELLIVGRRNLLLGSLERTPSSEHGMFVVRRSVPWDELSPLSPHPLKAPLAAARLSPGLAIVGSSDRAALVALDPELAAPRFAERALPITSDRCHALTGRGIEAEARACSPPTSVRPETANPAPEAASLDGVAFLAHADERGIMRTYELVSGPGGQLTVTIESPLEQRRTIQLPRGGAQVALADLDGDTVVEAITTAASESDQDTLQIHALTNDGAVLVASRSISAVRALAVCPFTGKNPQRLAVLLGSEVRIFE